MKLFVRKEEEKNRPAKHVGHSGKTGKPDDFHIHGIKKRGHTLRNAYTPVWDGDKRFILILGLQDVGSSSF